MKLSIERYNGTQEEEWDRFVAEDSFNGTIFHTRNFLNYHPPGRFEDASILLRDGEKLVGILPACKAGNEYISHKGAPYGGPVVHRKYCSTDALKELVEAVDGFYEGNIGMRIPENPMCEKSCDALVYLFAKTHPVVQELGVFKRLPGGEKDMVEEISRKSTRSSVKQLMKSGFTVVPGTSEEDYQVFYAMLEENLRRHDTAPVHSLEELLVLKHRLGEHQALLFARSPAGQYIAGAYLFQENANAWEAYYVAKDYVGSTLGAVPFLYVHCMEFARARGARYFNLGLCTREQGRILNASLMDFKESLGGEAVFQYRILPRQTH